ncbi:MAG: hypothetical protein LBL83_06160 [Clostridiales bacterium]|jgi:hypothetical protein|nr:hypothetical protein [Clostridiales bacterium]
MGVSEGGCGRTRAFHGAVSISGTAGFFGGKTLGIRARAGNAITIGCDRDAALAGWAPLRAYDAILAGDLRLVFMPFCDGGRRWA